ncbi:MAG TPA: hypothetical protein VKW76_12410 [Candidatus Binatia bacterium]|nr:hypothetical protein [Candidatus Binatia bacterium]
MAPPFAPLGIRTTGRLIGLFSFDVGYEVDLEHARRLAAAGEVRELAHRRAAPPYLGYTTPPLRIPLGTRAVVVGEQRAEATVTGIVHDFGAVTIALDVPLACDVAALPALTATLTGAGPLEDAARELLRALADRLRPAVTKPGLNAFVEDYYVIQLDRLEPPLPVPALLARAGPVLASALRCEANPLADAEVEDALRTRLSYYPEDLVVMDWNVALVLDADYADAANVFEFLNVQLLELRFYDALLDARVAEFYARTAGPAPRLRRYTTYRRTIEELAAIRLDVTTIFERIHNALKLSGDLYLAKVYARTAERLSLRAWEDSVAGKLDVLRDLYNVLVERVTTARAEALELTIIVLIVVELAVLLAGWG